MHTEAQLKSEQKHSTIPLHDLNAAKIWATPKLPTQRRAEVSALVRLQQSDMDWLLGQPHVRRVFGDGERFNSVHNLPGRFYMVESGWLAECVFLKNGGRQILDFYLPGDLIMSEDRICDQRDSNFEAIGLTSVLVFDFPVDQSDPKLTAIEKQVLAIRAQALGDLLVNVGRRNAVSRLAYFLLRIDAKRRARPDGDDCLTVPPFVTQTDIADHICISTVHTNKTLAKLRNAGFVSQQGQAIKVQSRDDLLQLAE